MTFAERREARPYLIQELGLAKADRFLINTLICSVCENYLAMFLRYRKEASANGVVLKLFWHKGPHGSLVLYRSPTESKGHPHMANQKKGSTKILTPDEMMAEEQKQRKASATNDIKSAIKLARDLFGVDHVSPKMAFGILKRIPPVDPESLEEAGPEAEEEYNQFFAETCMDIKDSIALAVETWGAEAGKDPEVVFAVYDAFYDEGEEPAEATHECPECGHTWTEGEEDEEAAEKD